jgi:hypothetical protein
MPAAAKAALFRCIRAVPHKLQKEPYSMTHVPHELHEEFPQAGDALHRLKLENAHFAKLADEYHQVNREIHRIEADVEAASDARTEELKRRRLTLKDAIAEILRAA